jgi:mRNA interferase MazF
MEFDRGQVWWVRLDPTQGSEIQKTRPCVIVVVRPIARARRTLIVIPTYDTRDTPISSGRASSMPGEDSLRRHRSNPRRR